MRRRIWSGVFILQKDFVKFLIGLLPYLVITLVFAVLAKPLTYSLGVLPSWLNATMKETRVGEALSYYSNYSQSLFMPFYGLSPRLYHAVYQHVTFTGYQRCVVGGTPDASLGQHCPACVWLWVSTRAKNQNKVNTGIKIGIHRKRRKRAKHAKYVLPAKRRNV